MFLEKCHIKSHTISPSSHSYLTFRSGPYHTYTHLSRTHAWIHLCHRPSHSCRRRNRSLMTQPALSRRVGVIYAALDEAVSFVSLTSPVSLSERLSARAAPDAQLRRSRPSRSLRESPTQHPRSPTRQARSPTQGWCWSRSPQM